MVLSKACHGYCYSIMEEINMNKNSKDNRKGIFIIIIDKRERQKEKIYK